MVIHGRRVRLRDHEGVFLDEVMEVRDEEEARSSETVLVVNEEGGVLPQQTEGDTREELERATAKNERLKSELSDWQSEAQQQKDRYVQLWRMNCEQLTQFDTTLQEKEEEIQRLREQLRRQEKTPIRSCENLDAAP